MDHRRDRLTKGFTHNAECIVVGKGFGNAQLDQIEQGLLIGNRFGCGRLNAVHPDRLLHRSSGQKFQRSGIGDLDIAFGTRDGAQPRLNFRIEKVLDRAHHLHVIAVGIGHVTVIAAIDIAGEQEIRIDRSGRSADLPLKFGQRPAAEHQPFPPQRLCIVQRGVDLRHIRNSIPLAQIHGRDFLPQIFSKGLPGVRAITGAFMHFCPVYISAIVPADGHQLHDTLEILQVGGIVLAAEHFEPAAGFGRIGMPETVKGVFPVVGPPGPFVRPLRRSRAKIPGIHFPHSWSVIGFIQGELFRLGQIFIGRALARQGHGGIGDDLHAFTMEPVYFYTGGGDHFIEFGQIGDKEAALPVLRENDRTAVLVDRGMQPIQEFDVVVRADNPYVPPIPGAQGCAGFSTGLLSCSRESTTKQQNDK